MRAHNIRAVRSRLLSIIELPVLSRSTLHIHHATHTGAKAKDSRACFSLPSVRSFVRLFVCPSACLFVSPPALSLKSNASERERASITRATTAYLGQTDRSLTWNFSPFSPKPKPETESHRRPHRQATETVVARRERQSRPLSDSQEIAPRQATTCLLANPFRAKFIS